MDTTPNVDEPSASTDAAADAAAAAAAQAAAAELAAATGGVAESLLGSSWQGVGEAIPIQATSDNGEMTSAASVAATAVCRTAGHPCLLRQNGVAKGLQEWSPMENIT